MEAQNATKTMAGNEYATEATEGDVIRVSQYKGALRVNHVSNIMIGVEFVNVNKKNSTNKHMVINENSGNLYLVAGTSDKGKVGTVEVMA